MNGRTRDRDEIAGLDRQERLSVASCLYVDLTLHDGVWQGHHDPGCVTFERRIKEVAGSRRTCSDWQSHFQVVLDDQRVPDVREGLLPAAEYLAALDLEVARVSVVQHVQQTLTSRRHFAIQVEIGKDQNRIDCVGVQRNYLREIRVR